METLESRNIFGSVFKQNIMRSGNESTNNAAIMPLMGQFPLNLAITMRLIDGFDVVDKFGFNALITATTDPEDIWEGGGIYPYDTFGTAPIISLASNNAADTQVINISGLDINGDLVSQNIQLSGTARVALTTPLWRVFRMENEGDTNLVGTCFCYTGTGAVPVIGAPEVRALIDNGNNQTQMALYTVPKGKVGFLFRGELCMELTTQGTSSSEYANMQYKSRRLNKVFKIKKTIPLISTGTTVFQETRSFPDIIPDLTDIKLTVKEVSTDLGVTGAFDILLVDEDILNESFLTAIGQTNYIV